MSSYIDAINQAANITTVENGQNSENESVMGKEDFLTLLVAQLQNQDPLNPDEPTEFTAQLAQFSSLEQLFTLNDGMESLVNAYENSDKMATLSTIGKEVAFQSNTVRYSDGPVSVGYQLDIQALEVTVQIQNKGATVATLEGREVTPGHHFISWDGMTSDGQPAPEGEYNIVAHATTVSGEVVRLESLVRSEVTGVDLSGTNGGTLITIDGEIGLQSILGVYEQGVATTQEEEPDTSEGQGEEDQESVVETVSESIDTIAEVTDDVAKLTE